MAVGREGKPEVEGEHLKSGRTGVFYQGSWISRWFFVIHERLVAFNAAFSVELLANDILGLQGYNIAKILHITGLYNIYHGNYNSTKSKTV